ncbi:MAG: glycine cleavage system protein R, partial [Rhodospirillaceae bacterium]
MAVAEKTATQSLRLTLTCADRTGLVSTVASVLFDLGADLGDTSFTILGSSAQLSTVFDIAADVDVREIHNALEAIDILQDATLRLESTLPDTTVQSPETTVTHRVIVSGGDRPGLIARLSEGFGEFGANIVRMDSKRLEETEGMRY